MGNVQVGIYKIGYKNEKNQRLDINRKRISCSSSEERPYSCPSSSAFGSYRNVTTSFGCSSANPCGFNTIGNRDFGSNNRSQYLNQSFSRCNPNCRGLTNFSNNNYRSCNNNSSDFSRLSYSRIGFEGLVKRSNVNIGNAGYNINDTPSLPQKEVETKLKEDIPNKQKEIEEPINDFFKPNGNKNNQTTKDEIQFENPDKQSSSVSQDEQHDSKRREIDETKNFEETPKPKPRDNPSENRIPSIQNTASEKPHKPQQPYFNDVRTYQINDHQGESNQQLQKTTLRVSYPSKNGIPSIPSVQNTASEKPDKPQQSYFNVLRTYQINDHQGESNQQLQRTTLRVSYPSENGIPSAYNTAYEKSDNPQQPFDLMTYEINDHQGESNQQPQSTTPRVNYPSENGIPSIPSVQNTASEKPNKPQQSYFNVLRTYQINDHQGESNQQLQRTTLRVSYPSENGIPSAYNTAYEKPDNPQQPFDLMTYEINDHQGESNQQPQSTTPRVNYPSENGIPSIPSVQNTASEKPNKPQTLYFNDPTNQINDTGESNRQPPQYDFKRTQRYQTEYYSKTPSRCPFINDNNESIQNISGIPTRIPDRHQPVKLPLENLMVDQLKSLGDGKQLPRYDTIRNEDESESSSSTSAEKPLARIPSEIGVTGHPNKSRVPNIQPYPNFKHMNIRKVIEEINSEENKTPLFRKKGPDGCPFNVSTNNNN